MMSPHNSILFPRTPQHDCQLSFSTTNFLCCTPTGKPIIISSRLRLSAEAPTLNAIHGYGFHVKCCFARDWGGRKGFVFCSSLLSSSLLSLEKQLAAGSIMSWRSLSSSDSPGRIPARVGNNFRDWPGLGELPVMMGEGHFDRKDSTMKGKSFESCGNIKDQGRKSCNIIVAFWFKEAYQLCYELTIRTI